MFENYGLVLEDKKRLYLKDLTRKEYDLENTYPNRIEIGDDVIIENTWGSLVQKVSEFLISKSNKTSNEIVQLSTSWSKQNVFDYVEKTNYKRVSNELFVNCNHTALHSCWQLQEILDFFECDKHDVRLYIERHQIAEPNEIKTYVINSVKNDFKFFLIHKHSLSELDANKIVNDSFDRINYEFGITSHSYINFYLFYDLKKFDLYKSNFLAKIKTKRKFDATTINEFKNNLSYLREYFKKSGY